MGIGWEGLDDLSNYKSKESIQNKLKEIGDRNTNYNTDSLALWHFAHVMKIGDVIFAKKGRSEIVGRGVVESDYIYEPQRDEYRHVRKVNWTNDGSWEHPGSRPAAMQTLTNITDRIDYIQKLNSLFIEDEDGEPIDEKTEVAYAPYSEDDFLKEVFMKKEQYQMLVDLLRNKKNIIIQGAPGVGKTFAAKRLAYSMIDKKDTTRVKMVQFHQSSVVRHK